MAITPLPAAPSRAVPSTFSTLADAFLGALSTFVTEANALETNVNAKEVSAAASAASALSRKTDAEAAAALAALTVGAAKWVSGTTYTIGNVVWSPINYRAYRRKTDGAGTIDPSSDAINWTALLPFATAAEITTGTEPAKAIAPDQLALTKYNGDWSFWGIKNLRLVDVYSGDHTKVKVNPSAYNIPILIGDHWHVMTSAVTVSSVDDLDTGALAAGTDYYIYACTDGTTSSFKVSANATNPTGFDANHSRKIGGFHTLCVAVGTISGHTLTGYAQKDILPASIWDLKHRARCGNNAGMVYDHESSIWVDIYLASGTGASTASINGATISDTRSWLNFVDDGGAVGKRLTTDPEFMMYSRGSNQGTNIYGSADPVTTGGHSDTATRRMISNIGCEDCCGAMWQWLDYPYGANMLIAGGAWLDAASCGSRYRNADNARASTAASVGARFAVEPL